MRREWKILLLLAVLAMVLAVVPGCSDDDDDPTTVPTTQTAPDFALGVEDQIPLPDGVMTSDDPYATMLSNYRGMTNGFITYLTWFTPPATKVAEKDGPPWVSTWSQNGMTITLTVDETAETYTWAVTLNGTDGETVYQYEAEAAKDDSWGTLAVYEWVGGSATEEMTWNWATDTEGIFTMEMRTYGYDASQWLWEVLPSGAGTLDMNEWATDAWQLAMHFQWDAVGNGSWAQYSYGPYEEVTGSWEAVPTK